MNAKYVAAVSVGAGAALVLIILAQMPSNPAANETRPPIPSRRPSPPSIAAQADFPVAGEATRVASIASVRPAIPPPPVDNSPQVTFAAPPVQLEQPVQVPEPETPTAEVLVVPPEPVVVILDEAPAIDAGTGLNERGSANGNLGINRNVAPPPNDGTGLSPTGSARGNLGIRNNVAPPPGNNTGLNSKGSASGNLGIRPSR